MKCLRVLMYCFLVFFSFLAAGASGQVLTVNGNSTEYSTAKFFIDERAGDTVTLNIVFDLSGVANLTEVELFTNLDRRDCVDNDWDGNGIPDGVKQPDFNTITLENWASGHNGLESYFIPYSMNDDGNGVFSKTLTVSKCGAYRLTARFKTSDSPNWQWFPNYYHPDWNFPEAQQAARSYAVVLSPKKALEMTLYEVNPLTVEADNNDFWGRSTFHDLLGEGYDTDGNDPFNLDYLNTLQINCLWFQPIHPNGEDSRTRAEGYTPGSPYATRDYFAVSPLLGDQNTEEDALSEFQDFVRECDNYSGSVGTINVMLDFVANHTSWDAEFGQGAVDLGFVADKNMRIGYDRWYWYADGNDGGHANYGDEADSYVDEWNNDMVCAPDRGDFGKWDDAVELYFGRYSALVCRNPEDNSNYLNEGDWFDYLSMTPGVTELWRYFGYYPEFWLVQTGHPANNDDPSKDNVGIDALRCDFGQGLPPQLWEYIINRTRSKKWNMVFMAETLDGGKPGYRSNRHFDILNENIVFQFTQTKVNNCWEIRSAIENRRNSYNGGAILLNITGHDEILPDNDAWVNASRVGALSTVAGLPMIFMGMEKGIQNYNPDSCCWYYDGFKTDHELNFGKYVPHFKQYNQLLVWYPGTQPPNATGMDQWYGRLFWARLNSPALQSHNQWFLSRTDASGGGDLGNLFAVAKYQEPYVGPTNTDIVLAFSLLLPHGGPHNGAIASYNLRGDQHDTLWHLLGLDVNKNYTARNLASSDASAELPGWPKSGQDLYDNGVYVSLQADNGQAITADGALVQFLKIEEAPLAKNYGTISLAGTYNGWSPSANPMTLVADHSWEITFELTDATDPEFKFVADNSFDNDDWGDSEQADLTPPIALEHADKESVTNIRLLGTYSGQYTFTFYDDSENYKVASLQNSAPTLVMPGPYTVPVGQNITRPVSAYDTDQDMITLSAIALPAGASFTDNGNNSGSFSWAPGADAEGTTNLLTITADDGQGEGNSIVTNTYEIVVPRDSDTDNLPDGWEYSNFGNIYAFSGDDDNDGDRCNNYCEWLSGTLPGSGESQPRITTVTEEAQQMTLVIPTVDGRRYTIEYSDSFRSSPANIVWHTFETGGTHDDVGEGDSHTFTDEFGVNTPQAPAGGQRAYRFKIEKL